MNADHDNCDAVRLVAALAVFVSHQLFLMNGQLIPVTRYLDLGWGGVMVFFALSGYLVAGSWERDPHVVRFLMRRCLRIWPGLTVVTLMLTFVVDPLMTSWRVADYLRDLQTWRFLGHLVLMPTEVLPGVFDANPMQKVDGPLWTLPLECGWYVLLTVAGATVMRMSRHAVAVIWAACAFWLFIIEREEAPNVPRMFFFEFGLMFIGGTLLWVYRALYAARRLQFGILLGTLAVCAYEAGHAYLAFAVLLLWMVIAIATMSTVGLRHAGRYGDLSYGVYICGFPLQQIVLSFQGETASPVIGGLISLPLTLALAWLSWHGIESRMLRFKPTRPHPAVPEAGACRSK
ncbi:MULTISPECIES: acyltransferase [unclassified Caballeronia]|uniref:acyltransferase family protein n=1 Tax=unclassified Caballeronia TaxID=2646786 RepID=UPI00285A61F1|nr:MULTISPECIES: acyltransferase [unclassified Caballeronia]MDR5776816.1 acyltransferase [Caballeronia sp. LZ002]MDR5798675.1 acyltransferase [Caballeronia sp. LZ001]MDR5852256.1 acyltransferase [Caballeronia sp. LZ003]